MARAVPSFGARMKTLPLSAALAAVRLASARFLAVLKSQLVVIWPMILAIFVAGQRGLVLQGRRLRWSS